MKGIIITLFVLAGFQVYGQKHQIQVNLAEENNPEKLISAIQKIGLIGIDPASESQVWITYDLSKVYQLEGISNSFSGIGKVWVRLKNNSGSLDTTWSFSSNLKEKNKWEAAGKLSSSFVEDNNGLRNTITVINTALDRYYSQNCSFVLEEANNYFQRKNWKEAYLRVKQIETGPCAKDAQALVTQIENSYSDEFCLEVLPRIKVLAASGITYQMEKAIELLYRYPARARCSGEIEKVAKSVGDYISKLPQKQSVEINNILSNGQTYNRLFGY